MENLQKRGLAVVIILAALFLLAAGCAIHFLIGAMQADTAIAAIDSTKYTDVAAEKGEQYKQKGEPLTAEIEESLEGTVYHTPLGFPIISYSNNWTGDKLVEIYDQLLKNKHGDEIRYITQIELYPDEADYGEDFNVAGELADADIDPLVYVDVRALVPSKLRYDTDPVVSEISLYYMDDYDDAAEVAGTLAHEYGHHYTMYYFMQDEDAIRESEYYTLRDVDGFGHEVFFYTAQSYYDNYIWDIYEIGANDYVQLMGSPDARQTGEYMDGYDLLHAGVDSYMPEISNTFWNVFPQDNIFIPLADEVPGLRDYFYSFIGLENEYITPLGTVDFNLQIGKHSSYGHQYYDITWTMVNTHPDALYTLVCYDSDGETYWPVRTVYGDEEAIARVGSPVIQVGNWIYWWPDGIPDEDRYFKLYLLLPDGRMIASEPFYVDF